MTLVDAETGEIVTVAWNGKVHPLAESYKEYTPARLRELADDIAAHGLDYAITLAPDGTLLDGRHRRLACEMAGVEPRFEVHVGDPVHHINSRNLMRMHLTRTEEAAERKVIVTALRGQGMSTTAIAEKIGVSQSQVDRDTHVTRDGQPGSDDAPTKVTGKDGRSYPTAKFEWTTKSELAFLEAYDAATATGKALVAQGYGLTAKSATSAAARIRKKHGIASRMDTAGEKRDRIRELATGPKTSAQIASEVGLSEGTVREYARHMSIEIAGDRAMFNRKRIESTDVMNRLVDGFDISEQVLGMVDYSALDRDRLGLWVISLEAAIKSLQDIKKKLTKEMTR